MTDKKQPDALELASVAESADLAGYPTAKKANAYYLCLLEDFAQMSRKLHAELEALRAKLKVYEDLGDAADDVQLLRMGYTAARLEIESLKAQRAKEHADELAVAYMCGASREKELAAQQVAAYAAQDSEHQLAIMEGERNASLDAYSRVAYLTGAESRLYEAGFTNGWDRRDRLASYGQAPAQPAPAAVAGQSGYGPKVTVKRRCSDCKACNSESYAVQGDSGHYVYCEHPSLPERKYIGDTRWDTPGWCPAAAPTTQPAPQQEPILYDPKALLEAFQNAQAGSSSPAGTLRGIAAVIASWESREPHTLVAAGGQVGTAEVVACGNLYAKVKLRGDAFGSTNVGDVFYSAPQPSPAAQGDALDAARYRWLRDPTTNVALVLDKRTGYVPEDELVPGVGDDHAYEYRAGDELDAAIDAARARLEQP